MAKAWVLGVKKELSFYIYQIFLLKKHPELNVQKESIKQHWNFFSSRAIYQTKSFLRE